MLRNKFETSPFDDLQGQKHTVPTQTRQPSVRTANKTLTVDLEYMGRLFLAAGTWVPILLAITLFIGLTVAIPRRTPDVGMLSTALITSLVGIQALVLICMPIGVLVLSTGSRKLYLIEALGLGLLLAAQILVASFCTLSFAIAAFGK